jgi:hypothetical protein
LYVSVKEPKKQDDDVKLAKYAKATSISSDQFFSKDDDDEDDKRTRMSKFGNSTSISSDAYFDRESDDQNQDSNSDLNNFKEVAAAKAQQFASFASGLFKGARARYG